MCGQISSAGKVVFRTGSQSYATMAIRSGRAAWRIPTSLGVGRNSYTARFIPSAPVIIDSISALSQSPGLWT